METPFFVKSLTLCSNSFVPLSTALSMSFRSSFAGSGTLPVPGMLKRSDFVTLSVGSNSFMMVLLTS